MTKEERGALVKSLSTVIKEIDTVIRKWVTDELKALSDLIEERFKSLPVPKDGRDGKDGKDADINHVQILSYLDKKVADSVSNIPVINGKDGRDGATGSAGRDGIDGLSGVNGTDGKDGREGIDGKHGIDGINGKDGAAGLNGIDGRDGREGKDGRDGKDGERGKDALDLEILPAIDMAKAYPRGTFAKWNGGLVRAMKNIEPGDLSGWDVIVEGIAALQVIKTADPRCFTLDCVVTSGKTSTFTFSMPVMIYRGTYSVSEKYMQGCTVTHQGSLWHCNVDNPDGTPGHSESWTLVAKRGQDGKLLVKEVEVPPSKALSLK